MSRPKRQQIKARIKREANKLITAGVPKRPSRKLVRLAKLHNVSLTKFHHEKSKNKKY